MGKKHDMLLNCSIIMSGLMVRPKLRFCTKMSMKQTRKIRLQRIQILSSRTPYKWGKKIFRFWIARLWYPSQELGVNYDFGPRWAWNGREKSVFNEFSFSAYEPLRFRKKKHFRLLNRSILRSELRVSPKLQFWAKTRTQTRKIGLQGIQLVRSRTP